MHSKVRITFPKELHRKEKRKPKNYVKENQSYSLRTFIHTPLLINIQTNTNLCQENK